VVFDQVRTDTALYADVLLPATAFLEHRELARGYGAWSSTASSRWPRRRRGAAELRGLRRPDAPAGAGEAGRRRGARASTSARCSAARTRTARRWPQLDDAKHRRRAVRPEPIQFVDNFPRTADRKAHLVPESSIRETPHGLYTYQPDPATEAAPLALISPADQPHHQ
jgi:anaerobic selenocysteine-containing dehydrogenase